MAFIPRSATLIVTLACAGCVAIPMQAYVADAAEGSPVYEQCSFNSSVPVGVKVAQPGIEAVVSIVQHTGRGFVAVQFDVPPGKTLVLRRDSIRIDARNAEPAVQATIANINPARPAVYDDPPAIRKLLLPVDTPLQGGRINAGAASSNKHYWIAAPFEGWLAGDVWITLPTFTINGVEASFREIQFHRRFMIGTALFNC